MSPNRSPAAGAVSCRPGFAVSWKVQECVLVTEPLPQGRRGHREARTRNDWLAHERGADDSEEGSGAYDGARFGAASV
jgi:hypothetical protein